MVKVRVENFQSIKDATIEIDGFTVVTGKNNSGKSALQRAIKSAFTNALGHSFVRYGEDSCKVSVEFEDGSFSWEKGEKIKPTYHFNESGPIHCGRNAPKELDEFKIAPVKISNREIWPQIAPQFTGQIFLIDLPSSVMAEVVADVDRVSQLNSALRSCDSDKRSCNSRLKIRREDYQSLNEELEEFEDFDEHLSNYGELSQTEIELKNQYSTIEELNSIKELYSQYSQEVDFLDDVDGLSVPNISFISDTLQELETLKEIQKRRNRYLSQIDILTETSTLEVPDLSSIKDLMRGIADLKSLRKRITEVNSQISNLEVITNLEIPPTDSLDLKALLQELESLNSSLVDSKELLSSLEGDKTNMEKELEDLNLEINSTLAENGSCPVCLKEFNDG